MGEVFDPYYQWLGIRDSRQPPDHYRLLGVAPFEDDPEVLQNAADRQMAHVRTFQTGRHSAESQQVLNELAAAKLCLLSAEKKAGYDALLRIEQAGAELTAGRALSRCDTPGESSADAAADWRPQRASSFSKMALTAALSGGLALLLAGLIFAWAHGRSTPAAARTGLTKTPLAETPRTAEGPTAKTRPAAKPKTEVAVKPKPAELAHPIARNGTVPRADGQVIPEADVSVKPKADLGAKPGASDRAKPQPDVGAKPQSRQPAIPPATPAAPPVEDRRIAPPSEEAQANARREVVSFFLADYAAAVYPDPQKALAEKLYLQATQTHDDPTARYVLDTEARDIAVAAGAVGLLEKVLANLGEGYRVKVQAMTVEMLAKAAKHPRDMSATNDPARIKLLVKAAKQPRDPSARRELPPTSALDMLAKTAKQLWDPAASHDLGRMALKKAADSMRRGDIDAAESLVESASEMAHRANDGPTVIQATALAKEVQERRRRSGF